jgi:MIP family channel proteins
MKLNLQYREERNKKLANNTLVTVSEKVDKFFVKSILGEFFGSLLFLFISITSVSYTVEAGGAKAELFNSIAMTFGFSIMVLVYIFASISGANINPSVSLSLVTMNQLSVIKGASYVVAQLLGGTVGTGLARYVGGNAYDALGNGAINSVADGVDIGQAFIGEMIMTSLLCITVLAASDPVVTKKFNHNSAILPFSIGMSVFLGHQCLIPLTNCSINPMRSFATSLVAGKWEDQWLFWCAPLTGSLLATVLWKVLGPAKEELKVTIEEISA